MSLSIVLSETPSGGKALEYTELCLLNRSLEEQRMFRGYDLAIHCNES